MLRRRPDVHPLSFMQIAMGLGALMVAPLYLWEYAQGERMSDDWWNYAGIIFMAVFPSFISYLFFNRGVQLIGATRAGQSTHLIPIFGSFHVAVLLLGESIHLYHLAGVVPDRRGHRPGAIESASAVTSVVVSSPGRHTVICGHLHPHPRARSTSSPGTFTLIPGSLHRHPQTPQRHPRA